MQKNEAAVKMVVAMAEAEAAGDGQQKPDKNCGAFFQLFLSALFCFELSFCFILTNH